MHNFGRSMRGWLLGCLLLSLLVQGCTQRYVLTLNNGMRVTTSSKPKLREGAYIFKDAAGRPSFVPAGRVREVSPASMAKEEKARFNPSAGKQD